MGLEKILFFSAPPFISKCFVFVYFLSLSGCDAELSHFEVRHIQTSILTGAYLGKLYVCWLRWRENVHGWKLKPDCCCHIAALHQHDEHHQHDISPYTFLLISLYPGWPCLEVDLILFTCQNKQTKHIQPQSFLTALGDNCSLERKKKRKRLFCSSTRVIILIVV